MTPLETAIEATLARLRALDEAERQQRIRWGAYAEMNAGGLSHRQIALVLADELAKRGLDEEQVRAAGVSHDSITLALSRLKG